MSELIEATQQQELTPVSQATALMAVIERVATNPEADISKLEKMLDMQERILDRNAKQQFTADLAAMQIELPRVIEHGTLEVTKDGRLIHSSKFAKLEDINDAIRPVLQKFGFAVTFRIKHEAQLMWITTVLSHKEGHSEETSIPLALDTSGSKNAVQAVGSTISYGKRYGICAMLNISTGDDVDGNIPSDDGPKLITKEQTLEIMGLLTEKGISTEVFCKRARINAVHELQADRFDAAVSALKQQVAK